MNGLDKMEDLENVESEELDFSAEGMAEKIAKLQELITTEQLTPEAQAAREEAAIDAPDEIKGSDVDWDDYELDPNFAHYYPRAVFKESGDGPKWLVSISEFKSDSKPFRASGHLDKNGEPRELGDYLTWVTNGPEGWRIAQVMDNGTGFAGVLFQRQVLLALPDPVSIALEDEISLPSDEELAETEDKSLAWAGLSPEEAAEEAANYVEGEDHRGISEVHDSSSPEIPAS